MDICLINPPTTREGNGPIYFPLSLLALSAFVEREGFGTEVVDYDFEIRTDCFPRKNFIEASVKDLRKRFRAPIYGLTTVTTNFALALLMAEEIKRQMPGAKVILGGPQVSSVPKETLERFPSVDAVVVGEGEHTLRDYLAKNRTGEAVDEIPGLMTRAHLADKIFQKRTLEASLDDFPPADFSKVPIKEYAIFERFNVGYFLPFIEAGRGCPFDCTFCSTAIMWSRKYRIKSPHRIYEELVPLKKKYGFESFELIHDNFTTSRKYLHEFCNEFVRINQAGIKWSCASRVDTLYDEDLDLMVKAGCDGVFFGVETGSARMQKVIRKEIDLKEYDSLMTNCLNRGLRVNSGFILGFPEEKDGDMLETIQYVLKSKFQGVAHPSLNRLKALAGTELHKRHRSELRHLCRDEFSDVEDDLCLDLVRKHPDLFSSYYLVPHSDFSDQDLEDFISFCQSLTQNYYVMLNWILEKSVLGLRDLFDLWKNWPGKDSRTPTTEKVFGRFVTETVLPVIARSRLSQNASFMDGTASKFTASTI